MELKFGNAEPKKHSVKFNEIGTTVIGSIYVKNDALKELNNPSELIVTITKA